MDQFADNLNTLLTDCQPYTWIFATIYLFIIGAILMIPNEKCHSMALKALPFLLTGLVIALGAVYIGEWVTSRIVFTSGG
ncbi:MAG: hypothetical protein J6K58_06815 [Lachnospiraceae bacterium]|nr:hypothetical protein [Lachnospiraceae bacterium]MBP3458903.1 hypothetical protein [Lachnospiraceae bacterium]